MSHIIELLKEYEKVKKNDLDTRAIFVLEMIERVITYPPVEPHTGKDISIINENVQRLVKDLRKDKQFLFSVRISKIWKKREHLVQLAKNWHEIKNDFMDEINYHEEIKWLRVERLKLIVKQRESK